MISEECRKKAQEIGTWLYGPDEGISEGLVRTLIDKIATALQDYGDKRLEDAAKVSEEIGRGSQPPYGIVGKYIAEALRALKLKEKGGK